MQKNVYERMQAAPGIIWENGRNWEGPWSRDPGQGHTGALWWGCPCFNCLLLRVVLIGPLGDCHLPLCLWVTTYRFRGPGRYIWLLPLNPTLGPSWWRQGERMSAFSVSIGSPKSPREENSPQQESFWTLGGQIKNKRAMATVLSLPNLRSWQLCVKLSHTHSSTL